MELEKRKRVVVGEGQEPEKDRLKKLKHEDCGAGGSGGGAAGVEEEAAVPMQTEDEVEEFFAILRRMKEAVKYFDEKGWVGKEWRGALEQAAEDAVDDDGEGAAAKNSEEELVNLGFDLNAVAPEAAESGGA